MGNWYVLDEDGHRGNDAHSLNYHQCRTEPGFLNESAHDYRINGTSPLRGKGVDLRKMDWFAPEMAYDRSGNLKTTWDIGPYSYMAGAIGGATSTRKAMASDPRSLVRPGTESVREPLSADRAYSLTGRMIRPQALQQNKAVRQASGMYITESKSKKYSAKRNPVLLGKQAE